MDRLREAKLFGHFSHLVLEQVPQRLDELVAILVFSRNSDLIEDVVLCFDTTLCLDNIGCNRSLNQEPSSAV